MATGSVDTASVDPDPVEAYLSRLSASICNFAKACIEGVFCSLKEVLI